MNRLFFFFAMLCAFFICGEYGMTRPISSALFLTHFSVKAYPLAWLCIVPLNFLAIYTYNRLLPKWGPWKMVASTIGIVIAVNVSTALFGKAVPQLVFVQYLWKDVYVLLMLKQLWSMVHSTIPSEKASSLYGKIYGMGTVGAILGSLVPAFAAVHIGSEPILGFTLPVYALLLICYTLAFNRSKIATNFTETLTANPKPSEAVSLIKNSKALLGALMLVVFMQLSAGLMEYQFNANLELNILEKDLRAAYCGKLVGIINACSLVLQLFGIGLLFKMIDIKKSQALIPMLLGASALLSFAFPSFAMISFAYVFLKVVDFSFFNLVREMLYVPLSLDEKYRGKAIIDVFAYRSSKALMSLGILGLQLIAGEYLLGSLRAASIGICLFWFAAITWVSRGAVLSKAPSR